ENLPYLRPIHVLNRTPLCRCTLLYRLMPTDIPQMARAPVTLMELVQAQHRLRPILSHTPLQQVGLPAGAVCLKWENLNPTHSFKIRGALNAMLALDAAQREHGVIAASSGNHAQALAYAARHVGIKARILMPKHAPQRKVSGVKNWG